jgi:hypothetical protein
MQERNAIHVTGSMKRYKGNRQIHIKLICLNDPCSVKKKKFPTL